MVIKLADGSIRQPADILENVPIQVGKFVILCGFIVLDMDENFQALVILGRPFLATVEVAIDVYACTLSFQLCGERVDVYFPSPTSPLKPANLSPPTVPMHTVPPAASPLIMVFDGDGSPSNISRSPSANPNPIGIAYTILGR